MTSGDRHLRRMMAEYVEHYHRERNRQGLADKVIERVQQGQEISAAFGDASGAGGAQLILSRGMSTRVTRPLS
jgi:hypothetical protein